MTAMMQTDEVWLVCGGRDFNDADLMDEAMYQLATVRGFPRIIIHGGARGADTLAGKLAVDLEVDVKVYPADWEKHGKAAGAIRNSKMLTVGQPDVVVAFPGGNGTADMVAKAKRAMVDTYVVPARTKQNA